jgi:hypothetical protein
MTSSPTEQKSEVPDAEMTLGQIAHRMLERDWRDWLAGAGREEAAPADTGHPGPTARPAERTSR